MMTSGGSAKDAQEDGVGDQKDQQEEDAEQGFAEMPGSGDSR